MAHCVQSSSLCIRQYKRSVKCSLKVCNIWEEHKIHINFSACFQEVFISNDVFYITSCLVSNDRLWLPITCKFVCQVFGLLAFLLVVTSSYTCLLPGLNGFYDFAIMLCVVTTALLYGILVFKLHLRIFRCDCIVWPLVVSSIFSMDHI